MRDIVSPAHQIVDRVLAFSGRQPRFLSNLVARVKKKIYAGSTVLRAAPSGWTVALRTLPPSWLVIGVVTAIGMLIRRSVLPSDIITETAVIDILGKCIEILIGIVAIIIPLLILVIEFYGREAEVSDIIVRRAGVLPQVILVLLALALLASAYTLSVVYSFEEAVVSHSDIMVGGFIITIGVLVESARFAVRTVSSLGSEAVYEALENKLREEMSASLDEEMNHRLARLALENTAAELGIVRTFHAYSPREMHVLKAHATGFLVDVRIDRLKAFSEVITTIIPGRNFKAYLAKWLYDQVSKDEVIGYVSPQEENVQQVERALNKALIISPTQPRITDIRPTLDHLRDLTVRAIQEASEGHFLTLLSLYRMLVAFHTAVVAEVGFRAPPPAWTSDLFREWRVVTLMEGDLRNIVEYAARSESSVFIANLSYNLHQVASESMAGNDPRMFRLATDLFQNMYFHSHKANNELGKHRCYYYLTGQLTDFELARSLEMTEPTMEAVKEVKTYLDIVVGAITVMIKMSVDLEDIQHFIRMTRGAEELLAHYRPASTLWQESFEVRDKLTLTQHGTEEYESALRKQTALDFLINLQQKLAEHWRDTFFVLAGYTLNKYDRGTLGQELCREFMKVLTPKFSDFTSLFAAFTNVMSQEQTFPFLWDRFDEMPETKKFVWLDPERKYLLFYCLAGIQIVRLGGLPREVISSETLTSQHVDRIRTTCEEILKNKDKWTWFTGTEIDEIIGDLITLNEEIVTAKEQRREDKIIATPPWQDAILRFNTAASAAAVEQSKMRYWLEKYDVLAESDEVPDNILPLAWGARLEEKANFIEGEREGLAEELGRMYGGALARGVDNQVLQRLLEWASLATRQGVLTIDHAFTSALQWFQARGDLPDLIVIPGEQTSISLYKVPGFRYRDLVEHDHKSDALDGFYDDIPVLVVWNSPIQGHLLAIRLDKACRVLVTKPATEVGVLTQQEMQALKERGPELNDRVLALRVSARAWQYIWFEDIDEDAGVKVRLEPSE